MRVTYPPQLSPRSGSCPRKAVREADPEGGGQQASSARIPLALS